MDKLYYLVLYLLGLKNKELIFIMKTVPKSDLKKILSSERLEIEYKYNINLSKYEAKLSDKFLLVSLLKQAEEIIKKSKELDIKIITFTNRYYPNILKQIKDPPAFLYIKGKYITKSDEKAVGCVGSRNTTNFGITAVQAIVEPLTNEKFTIVSGLAIGIDSEAHKTCVNANGRTIAVLAHGLDQIYPKENKDLAEGIMVNGGTLVSEYPVGINPDKFRFVERNRIIAGLSKGIILFESKEKSGSMHTVNYSLENKRPVFCPVPTVMKESVLGLVKLIEDKKAIPLSNKNDYRIVVNRLGYKLDNKLDRTSNVKNEMLTKVNKYNNSKDDLINTIKQLQFDKYSTITTNDKIYNEFKDILKENNLTVKEFFNGVIINVVNNYKLGD